jgi:hypothetical protein
MNDYWDMVLYRNKPDFGGNTENFLGFPTSFSALVRGSLGSPGGNCFIQIKTLPLFRERNGRKSQALPLNAYLFTK